MEAAGDSPCSHHTACRAADAVGAGPRGCLARNQRPQPQAEERGRPCDRPHNPSRLFGTAVLLLGHEYHSQAAIVLPSGDATGASEDLPATSGDVRGVVELLLICFVAAASSRSARRQGS